MANESASRLAPSVHPRVYPAGRAVVLLAVCAPELAGRRLTVEGRRVQAIRFGRLALLLSFVDQQAYAPEELERKRGDAAWLASEARVLEQAVERTRVHGSVLPMRLTTTFAHAEALDESARESYPRWSRALTRLGGKSECVVHVYVGPHAPPGREPYVLRVSQRASRSARVPAMKGDPAVLAHAQDLWRTCSRLATATRRVHTGGRRGALWSAAMLVPESGVTALSAALEASVEAGSALGVSTYLEVPRAPFTFV
jgi:hypothetical protein